MLIDNMGEEGRSRKAEELNKGMFRVCAEVGKEPQGGGTE